MIGALLSSDLWTQLTEACLNTKRRSFVAVAYLGQSVAKRLPLREGSILVVDASEGAVKSGQTCPAELLKLYRSGVTIYSVPFLHAKVYVIGSRVFIGSNNISNRSGGTLIEAGFTTTDRRIVGQAKAFVESLLTEDLGPERLKQLQKLYVPPAVSGVSVRGKKALGTADNGPKFYVARLFCDQYSRGHEEAHRVGIATAKKKRVSKQRHLLDEFEWDKAVSLKEGDIVIQVVEGSGADIIYPPGRVIHIEPWKDGKRSFIFLEIPKKRNKRMDKLPEFFDRRPLNRSGKKSDTFGKLISQLWR
ncbi:MAG: hypothetical protein EOP50_01995 [Sphingobacteriales bacterium]|nr:MAG: hypothetical protein EOP50_01995 [Sphingobacteriales bacterium]